MGADVSAVYTILHWVCNVTCIQLYHFKDHIIILALIIIGLIIVTNHEIDFTFKYHTTLTFKSKWFRNLIDITISKCFITLYNVLNRFPWVYQFDKYLLYTSHIEMTEWQNINRATMHVSFLNSLYNKWDIITAYFSFRRL